MANPYYIPTETPASAFSKSLENSLGLGLQVYGLREKSRLANIQNDMESKKLAEQVRENNIRFGTGTPDAADFTPGLEQRKLGLMEKANTLQEKNVNIEAQKIPVHLRNFGMDQVVGLESRLNAQGEGVKKAFEPVTGFLTNMAKEANVDNMTAMGQLSSNWGFYRDKVIEGLSKEYQTQAAKDPTFTESPQANEIMKTIEVFGKTDDVGNILEKAADGTVIKKGNIPRDVLFQSTWASYVHDTTYEKELTRQMMRGEKTPEQVSNLIHPRSEAAYTPSFKGGYTGAKGEALSFDERTGRYTLAGTDTPYQGKVRTPQENVKLIQPPERAGKMAGKMDEADKQTLLGIRQDKRDTQKQIWEYDKLPNVDIYKAQKAEISNLKAQLADLNAQEAEITGRKIKAVQPQTGTSYRTAQEVKADFNAGKIKKLEAMQILRKYFGMK